MKKVLLVMMAFAAMMTIAKVPASAQADGNWYVHYDANKKASKGRPDFHTIPGVVVDIDIPDLTIRNVVQQRFEDLGVENFTPYGNHCVDPGTIICIRYALGPASDVGGSGYSSAYGNRGGVSFGGSFSGQQRIVVFSIFLVKYNPADGGNRPRVPLAEASNPAFAGSGNSYSTSYSGNGGGSYFAAESGGWNIGPPLSADIDALLSTHSLGGLFRKGLSLGTQNIWFRGSADAVKEAFTRPTSQSGN